MSKGYSLKWEDFNSNVLKSIKCLRVENDFHDVTLLTDDEKFVSAHKLVLSTSSEFFKKVLKRVEGAKPLIYLAGISSKYLDHILDYIYEGEAQIYQEELDDFLKTAQKLKIHGLVGAEYNSDADLNDWLLKLDKRCEQFESIMKDSEETKSDKGPENIAANNDQGDHFEKGMKGKANLDDSKVLKDNLESTAIIDLDKEISKNVSDLDKESGKYLNKLKSAAAEPLDKEMIKGLVKKKGKGWVCVKCNIFSRNQKNIQKHIVMHLQGETFDCNKCGKGFVTKLNLKNHKIRQCSMKTKKIPLAFKLLQETEFLDVDEYGF